MLTALARGVKGGKWYSLGDKALRLPALKTGFARVKSNDGAPGVDGITIERFESRLEENLAHLQKALADGSYRPLPARRVWIDKPGTSEKRPLGIPTVRDRVVQASLKAALEPIFEMEFCSGSSGFRPGLGCKKALSLMWKSRKANPFVVDVDLRKFFDTIPHEIIMAGLRSKVSDGRVLDLIRLYLESGVLEGLTWDPAEEGTPQGSVISPLLANIALHGLDVLAQERGILMVRYADDLVMLCKTREEAESALETVREWTVRNGLTLHPEKTRIVEPGQSFDFLGFTFVKDSFYPREASQKKLEDKVRQATPRSSGKSLRATILELNSKLRGWHAYFKSCPKHVFKQKDEFVRRRLRAMLAKRQGYNPWPSVANSKRWPIAFFAEHGLFSMEQAAKARVDPL
jgi:RNA-directed DNA polymerase